jgi:hypothetical protein
MKTNRWAQYMMAAGAFLLGTHAAFGQQAGVSPAREERTAKKQIIASQMELTDGEAERFWPVYDQFADELSKLNAWKISLIRDYARHYYTLAAGKNACPTQRANRHSMIWPSEVWNRSADSFTPPLFRLRPGTDATRHIRYPAFR